VWSHAADSVRNVTQGFRFGETVREKLNIRTAEAVRSSVVRNYSIAPLMLMKAGVAS
jgi:hypothetical protein